MKLLVKKLFEILFLLQHNLVVQARMGESTSEAKVNVQVLDANDHEPSFPKSVYETELIEEDYSNLPRTVIKVSVFLVL